MFRAFLGLTKKECKNMTMGEFLDYTVVLDDVLRIWHAPFMDHNN